MSILNMKYKLCFVFYMALFFSACFQSNARTSPNKQNKPFLKETQEKLLQDKGAFAAFKELGLLHCNNDTQEYSLKYSNLINNMSALVRLVKDQSLEIYFGKIHKNNQNCAALYSEKSAKKKYKDFILDKNIYEAYKVNNYLNEDTIQNRIDYLNFGKIDFKRLIDKELPLKEALEKDINALKNYQTLGISYCKKNITPFKNLREEMINDMHALPRLVKRNALTDSFDILIRENENSTNCEELFLSMSSRQSYINLIQDSKSFYDSQTPKGYGDWRQNILDYLNLGKIDSKRFIYQ